MRGRGVIRTFKDLVVWQKAFELAVAVYQVAEALPTHERYGLTAELRKTARSISYNIAEGHRRTSTAEYVRFLDIARGSAAELETQFCWVMHSVISKKKTGRCCSVVSATSTACSPA